MLSDYQGTVILISHDRDFIDRIVSTVIVPEGNGRWTEYAGGYSDMLAQRGDAPTRKSAQKNEAKATSPVDAPIKAAAPIKKKLSFQERHLLKTLPDTMEKLKSVIGKLQTRLADADFYTRDAKAFNEATAMLAKAQAEHDAQEERWLELEILREEIEGV